MMLFIIVLDLWKVTIKLEVSAVLNLYLGYMGLNVESIKNENGIREDH